MYLKYASNSNVTFIYDKSIKRDKHVSSNNGYEKGLVAKLNKHI